jgi:hypothetical protein
MEEAFVVLVLRVKRQVVDVSLVVSRHHAV